jgi:hypothetical protein
MTTPPTPRRRVTAGDLDQAFRLAVTALHQAPLSGWDNPAGSLQWTCWETAEHLCDQVSNAVQLGPSEPLLDATLPLARKARRPGGPATTVHVDRAAGPDGLLLVLEATGAVLAAMVRTRSPQLRAYHPYGISDPEGFAAMGITETLVHTHDLAQGLDLPWVPPADVCLRVLTRLFPGAPPGADSWSTLLWATGRGELPGHPRLTAWRWDSTVRS